MNGAGSVVQGASDWTSERVNKISHRVISRWRQHGSLFFEKVSFAIAPPTFSKDKFDILQTRNMLAFFKGWLSLSLCAPPALTAVIINCPDCINTPDTRDRWFSGYDINTDYTQQLAPPGKLVKVETFSGEQGAVLIQCHSMILLRLNKLYLPMDTVPWEW